MANLLTVTEIRQHVECDLVDTALQRIVDDIDAEIISRLGALDSVTETKEGNGQPYLSLLRRAASITSASVRYGQTDYALDVTTDLVLAFDNRMVQRLSGATLPDLFWRGIVTITYVPDSSDTVSRTMLEVNLVKLAVNYDGQKSVDIGDVKMSRSDYMTERDRLFAPFMVRNRIFLI